LFFENCIGWEGIRWWRFLFLWLGFRAGLRVRVLLGVLALGEMVIDGWICGSGLIWFAYLIVMIGSVSDLSL
jgi:hypothetical protein